MPGAIQVELLSLRAVEQAVPDLVALLVDCVESGASVGFIEPMSTDEAEAWWRQAIDEMRDGMRTIFVARDDTRVVGTAHLSFSPKTNASHRAEVQKLLVLRDQRRQGVGTRLMRTLDTAARQLGRTLLVLDTETGSDAARLYAALGWSEAGTIPDYAARPSGGLAPTTFYYKRIEGDAA